MIMFDVENTNDGGHVGCQIANTERSGWLQSHVLGGEMTRIPSLWTV